MAKKKKKPTTRGEWDDKFREFKAKKMEIELQKELGILLDADDVKKVAFDTGRRVRDGILGIPDRLSTMLAAEKDPKKIHELLTKELRKALENLNNAFSS